MDTVMKCCICKSDNIYEKYKLYDDRYGYDDEFQLYGCRDCVHLWLDCRLSLEQLSNLYTTLYPYNPPRPSSSGAGIIKEFRRKHRLTSFPLFKWLYGYKSRASQWIPENVRLLDIGCGVGDGFRYHIERGCDVYGIEANENVRALAEKSGYKIHIGMFDPKLYEPELFDYVTMDQVLEHMIDPLDTIQGISYVLKPHGKLVLTTPNAHGWGAKVFGRRWIHWHSPYHLHFFSRRSLEYLATRAGFKIIKHHMVTNSSWLNLQWMHLIFYPRKGESSLFFGRHLVQGKETTENDNERISIINRMDKWRINDLITRLFDMLHSGDNQVYILQKIH